MRSACPFSDTNLFLKSSVSILPSSLVLTPLKLPGLVWSDGCSPNNDLHHFCRWLLSLSTFDFQSLNLSSPALSSCGGSLRSYQMDPRHALGGVQCILRCYTDIAEFQILSSVEYPHVLSRYPLVSPREPPFPYLWNPHATNYFRCPRHYPYRHQGT